MKASELRIGNWVIDSSFGKGEYAQIDADWLFRFSDMPFDTIQPIPLTEEILLKAGFEQSDGFPNEFTRGNWIVYLHNPVNREVYFGTFDIKLKYLHELQNMWVLATKKELKIEL